MIEMDGTQETAPDCRHISPKSRPPRPSEIACIICKESVKHEDLEGHIAGKHLDYYPYRCYVVGCNSTFSSKHNANVHAEVEDHMQKEYRCFQDRDKGLQLKKLINLSYYRSGVKKENMADGIRNAFSGMQTQFDLLNERSDSCHTPSSVSSVVSSSLAAASCIPEHSNFNNVPSTEAEREKRGAETEERANFSSDRCGNGDLDPNRNGFSEAPDEFVAPANRSEDQSLDIKPSVVVNETPDVGSSTNDMPAAMELTTGDTLPVVESAPGDTNPAVESIVDTAHEEQISRDHLTEESVPGSGVSGKQEVEQNSTCPSGNAGNKVCSEEEEKCKFCVLPMDMKSKSDHIWKHVKDAKKKKSQANYRKFMKMCFETKKDEPETSGKLGEDARSSQNKRYHLRNSPRRKKRFSSSPEMEPQTPRRRKKRSSSTAELKPQVGKKTKKSSSMLICARCGEPAKMTHHALNHIFKHLWEEKKQHRFMCKVASCNGGFYSAAALTVHIRNQHPEKKGMEMEYCRLDRVGELEGSAKEMIEKCFPDRCDMLNMLKICVDAARNNFEIGEKIPEGSPVETQGETKSGLKLKRIKGKVVVYCWKCKKNVDAYQRRGHVCMHLYETGHSRAICKVKDCQYGSYKPWLIKKHVTRVHGQNPEEGKNYIDCVKSGQLADRMKVMEEECFKPALV